MKKSVNINILIAVIFLGIGFLSGVFIFKSKEVKLDKASSISKDKLENSIEGSSEDYTNIMLYFGANGEKSEVVREERLISNEELLGEFIIQELIKGPSVVGGGKAVLPKEARLLNFSIDEGVAYVNLSGEVAHEMEPAQEELVLKAIATSLSQIVTVDKVMLTVNNQAITTLGGNYDVSKPFSKDEISSLLIKK